MKVSVFIRSLMLWVLCPISPFVWLAVAPKQYEEQYLRRHLLFTAIIWIVIGVLFGLMGGQWIEKMKAFY